MSEKSLALNMFPDCNYLRKKYASANYLTSSEILFFCCCSPAVIDNLQLPFLNSSIAFIIQQASNQSLRIQQGQHSHYLV